MTAKAPPEIAFTQSKNYEMTATDWQAVGGILGPNREPSPLERQAIAEVHELAERFALDAVSTDEIRSACSGKQRWLATRFTAPTDRVFAPLMAMLDALIADEGRFKTKHGYFEPDDLFAANGRIVHEDGQAMLQFPYRWPWRIEPDKETRLGGERDEPVYRRSEQRGPFVTETDTRIEFTEVEPQPAEWWEAESTDEVPF